MKRRTPSLKSCRICGAPTSPAKADYPFCSTACRDRDLDNWASESYRVATVPNEDELPDIADALAQSEEEA